MATEEGIVTATQARTAWVTTQKSSTCKGCSSRDSCEMVGKEMKVEVANDVGAQVGDRIVLNINTGAFLKVTFLLYIFPIICMIAGAVFGQEMAPQWGMDASAASAIIGLGGFGAAFLIIRTLSARMAQNTSYRPRIIKILRSPPPQNAEANGALRKDLAADGNIRRS